MKTPETRIWANRLTDLTKGITAMALLMDRSLIPAPGQCEKYFLGDGRSGVFHGRNVPTIVFPRQRFASNVQDGPRMSSPDKDLEILEPFPGVRAHKSSYVDLPCEIGAGTRIWHFCHILSGARIGRDCRLGQGVMIAGTAWLGDGVKVQNNVSVYDGVVLEDFVFCGPSAVFTNVLNPRAEIERKSEYRRTVARTGATIGANATIICGVTLGRHSFVAAGAVVREDVPDHALMAGVPARRIGWMSRAGARLGVDLVCSLDGSRYELSSDNMLVAL
jgi:UDP-2-acetamido-3-amino-2,3-dideoxy-glucuronate N-acetyltransferase